MGWNPAQNGGGTGMGERDMTGGRDDRDDVAAGLGPIVSSGHLAAGVPAKDRGPMNAELAARVRQNAFNYQDLSARYRAVGG